MADTTKKYVSYNTLLYFWQKIKLKLAGKVDAETGKGLSANDFTNELKTKLEGLEPALGNDADFAGTMTTELAKKVNTADLVEVTNAEVDTIIAT